MPTLTFKKEHVYARLYRERHYLLRVLTDLKIDAAHGTERCWERDVFERPVIERRIVEIDRELEEAGMPGYDETKASDEEGELS